MVSRCFGLSLFFIYMLLLARAPQMIAQENQDNQPHIQPRSGTPEPPSKTPQQRPPAQSQNVPEQAEQQGESSSHDSQVDFNSATHSNLPVPGNGTETDDRSFTRWNPHRADKDNEVGNLYLKMKNYRAALERFNDALLYKPNDAEATFGLAVTEEKLDLLAKSQQNYSKYLEILPSGPHAKECHEALKRLEPRMAALAASSSSDAARQAEDDIAAGETFLARNDFASARERFEDALRLTPDSPLVNFRLAQSLQGSQQLEPARLFYQKYLDLDPKGRFAADAKKAIADISYIVGKK